MRTKNITEDDICKAFVKRLDAKGLKYSHIAHETYTPYIKVKMRNKAMGVKPGVPDYMVIVPTRTGKKLLRIEMKRPKGVVSKYQEERIKELGECEGCEAIVSYGSMPATMHIENMMK